MSHAANRIKIVLRIHPHGLAHSHVACRGFDAARGSLISILASTRQEGTREQNVAVRVAQRSAQLQQGRLTTVVVVHTRLRLEAMDSGLDMTHETLLLFAWRRAMAARFIEIMTSVESARSSLRGLFRSPAASFPNEEARVLGRRLASSPVSLVSFPC